MTRGSPINVAAVSLCCFCEAQADAAFVTLNQDTLRGRRVIYACDAHFKKVILRTAELMVNG